MESTLQINDRRHHAPKPVIPPPPPRYEKNVIPPITDPLGSGWDQPDTKLITIDDTHAMMSRNTFDSLHEYSATNPTGVYPGKMWKRHNGVFDREFCARGGKPNWLLVWYSYAVNGDPKFCSNNYRDILIV